MYHQMTHLFLSFGWLLMIKVNCHLSIGVRLLFDFVHNEVVNSQDSVKRTWDETNPFIRPWKIDKNQIESLVSFIKDNNRESEEWRGIDTSWRQTRFMVRNFMTQTRAWHQDHYNRVLTRVEIISLGHLDSGTGILLKLSDGLSSLSNDCSGSNSRNQDFQMITGTTYTCIRQERTIVIIHWLDDGQVSINKDCLDNQIPKRYKMEAVKRWCAGEREGERSSRREALSPLFLSFPFSMFWQCFFLSRGRRDWNTDLEEKVVGNPCQESSYDSSWLN